MTSIAVQLLSPKACHDIYRGSPWSRGIRNMQALRCKPYRTPLNCSSWKAYFYLKIHWLIN